MGVADNDCTDVPDHGCSSGVRNAGSAHAHLTQPGFIWAMRSAIACDRQANADAARYLFTELFKAVDCKPMCRKLQSRPSTPSPQLHTLTHRFSFTQTRQ